MNVLTLDCETKDPYLSDAIDCGPGWVYGINVPNHLFKVLGVSLKSNAEPSRYITENIAEEINKALSSHDVVVMHNAQYDLGCLEFLGIDTRNIKVWDTLIGAKLFDNTRFSYSLDNLLKHYFNESKDNAGLVELVKKHNLFPQDPDSKTYATRAEKWAKSNMDVLQDLDVEVIAKYANKDTDGTYLLYQKQSKDMSGNHELVFYYSRFQNICVQIRKKGIAVDLKVLKEGIAEMAPLIEELKDKLYVLFGEKFNIDSNQQLTQRLVAKGYELPKTQKSGDSVPKEWLEEHIDDPLISILAEYRTVNKIYRDFFISIKNRLQWTCPEALVDGATIGRVYPELNVLAAQTGRFSSSAPNIQQIPKRNAKWGMMCRKLFIPDPGKKWCSADFSNQEGRLQVHYAAVIKSEGSSELVLRFNKDPNLDLHQNIADLVGITRQQAKGVNLGLSYGMGKAKLAKTLKLNEHQAVLVKEQYNNKMPFLQGLFDATKKTIKERGYIRTLGGRLLRRELSPDGKINFDYKALNKLIQGSAADQCYKALADAYDAGLDILNCVHDEFNIQYTDTAEIDKLRSIMEQTYKLRVPMVAEVETGTSWGDLE